MNRRLRFAIWLFARSRTARTLFVITTWLPVYIADRIRGHEPPSWRRAMEWARDGKYIDEPTIRTSTTPARVRRR